MPWIFLAIDCHGVDNNILKVISNAQTHESNNINNAAVTFATSTTWSCYFPIERNVKHEEETADFMFSNEIYENIADDRNISAVVVKRWKVLQPAKAN